MQKQPARPVVLSSRQGGNPVVLVLISYDPVIWDVTAFDQRKCRAVVFAGFNPGSEVISAGVPIFQAELAGGLPGETLELIDEVPKSEMELFKFTNLMNWIEQVFGKPLTGYTGVSSADALLVPAVIVSEKSLKELKTSLDHNAEWLEKRRSGRTFDGMVL